MNTNITTSRSLIDRHHAHKSSIWVPCAITTYSHDLLSLDICSNDHEALYHIPVRNILNELTDLYALPVLEVIQNKLTANQMEQDCHLRGSTNFLLTAFDADGIFVALAPDDAIELVGMTLDLYPDKAEHELFLAARNELRLAAYVRDFGWENRVGDEAEGPFAICRAELFCDGMVRAKTLSKAEPDGAVIWVNPESKDTRLFPDSYAARKYLDMAHITTKGQNFAVIVASVDITPED